MIDRGNCAANGCDHERVLYSRYCETHAHAAVRKVYSPEVAKLKAEIERLKRRETDLLEANNRYLERARKAEAQKAVSFEAIVEAIDGEALLRDADGCVCNPERMEQALTAARRVVSVLNKGSQS